MELKTQSWIILLMLSVAAGAVLNNTQPPSSYLIPCEKGWFLFGDKCYKVFEASESVTWFSANASCADHNGTLVTIESQELQDFLTLFLLFDVKSNVWIGLNDLKEESNYTWTDGSIVNYTYWDDKEPSDGRLFNPNEDCVEMRYATRMGRWNDVDCDTKLPFICQKSKSEENMNHDPRFCSGENDGAWKLQNSCYHVVSEEMSWDDAEDYCQTVFNGHLLAIIDRTEELFIQSIVDSDLNRDIWIGIKIQDADQQMWPSGWILNYKHWMPYRTPNIGDCAYISKSVRYWYSTSCLQKLPLICEVPHVEPPPLKQAPEGWRCPELSQDWVDLGGDTCYIFETKKSKIWHQAYFDCITKGGHLASIHSVAEENAIHRHVKGGKETMMIGLYRSVSNSSVFEWADGTQLDYQNWKFGEPRRENLECGEIRTDDMKWINIYCGSRKGYICSAKKVPGNNNSASIDSQEELKENTLVTPFHNESTSIDSKFPMEVNSSVQPFRNESATIDSQFSVETSSSVPPFSNESATIDSQFLVETSSSDEQIMSHDSLFCTGGNKIAWKYKNSCYYTVNERLSWDDAENYCQIVFKGHLLAITGGDVDHFIKNFVLSGSYGDFWIGIKIQDTSRQMWSSSWDVRFNKWKYDQTPDVGTCAYMKLKRYWWSSPCSRKLPFVCEVPDVKLFPLKKAPDAWVCPELSQDWIDLGGDTCYIFETDVRRNWYEANFVCMKKGGHLASIRSVAEENAIFLRIKGFQQEGMLIGLHRSSANNSVFEWADGTELDYQNWKIGKPSNIYQACGAISNEDMKWNNIYCDDYKRYICSAKKVPPFRIESTPIDSQFSVETNSSGPPFYNETSLIDSEI